MRESNSFPQLLASSLHACTCVCASVPSLHLQREGHTFQRCFPTLALGDARPELISDRAPSLRSAPFPTSPWQPWPPRGLAQRTDVPLRNSALCPTSNPPHPPSFSEVGVFKEIACFLAAHLFCLHMVTVKLETSRRMRSRFHGHARQLLTRQTESGFRCHQVLTGFVTSDCTVRAAGAVLAALDRVWFQLFFFFLCDSSVKASRVRRGYGRMENSKRRQAMRERGVVVTLVSANSGKCVCVWTETRTGTQTHMCVFVGHGMDF